MEKVKIMDFQEVFLACALKIDRYRQRIEIKKSCQYSRSLSFFDIDQMSFTY